MYVLCDLHSRRAFHTNRHSELAYFGWKKFLLAIKMKFLYSVLFVSMSIQVFGAKLVEISGNDFEKVSSCKAANSSGVFKLKNRNVYCEMDSLEGGWTVIQQRINNNVSFDRGWAEYRDGFGTVEKAGGDFWLGLEIVHQLTKGGNCELAVELKDQSGRLEIARYSKFRLMGEADKYRLRVGNYSGNAGDELVYHGNDPFSTHDRDNDWHDDLNCARKYGSGWWYKDCFSCNLNFPEGAIWTETKSYSRMMVRCG